MRIDAKTMIEAIEAAGLEPTNYSGRGMYGRQCVSVSSDDGALHLLAEIIEALPQVADDDAQEDPTIMARLDPKSPAKPVRLNRVADGAPFKCNVPAALAALANAN